MLDERPRLGALNVVRSRVSRRTNRGSSIMIKQPGFPPGWDEARLRDLLEHYEQRSDDQAVAENEAAYESTRVP
jgi:hypothetical protein